MTDDDLGKLWNVARYQGSWDAFVETSRALESRVLAEGKREAVADCKCRRTGDWKGFHHPLCDANWSDEQEPKLWVAFSQSGQVMAYSSVEPHQSDVMMYEPLYAARCPAPKSANDVARAIFSVLHGSTMRLPNWDSGAILGPDNVVREEFLDAAQAVLEIIYK